MHEVEHNDREDRKDRWSDYGNDVDSSADSGFGEEGYQPLGFCSEPVPLWLWEALLDWQSHVILLRQA